MADSTVLLNTKRKVPRRASQPIMETKIYFILPPHPLLWCLPSKLLSLLNMWIFVSLSSINLISFMQKFVIVMLVRLFKLVLKLAFKVTNFLDFSHLAHLLVKLMLKVHLNKTNKSCCKNYDENQFQWFFVCFLTRPISRFGSLPSN